MSEAPSSDEYFRQIRTVMDAAIAAVQALYETSERNKKFHDACARIRRNTDQLTAMRKRHIQHLNFEEIDE